jgi:nucleotide-binding universal stress UspA family protein
MKKIVAAVDNSLAAKPVLASAAALAKLLDAEIEPVHVRVDGDRVARNAAEDAGLPLTTVVGPVVERLLELGRAHDVAGVVVGARGTPGSRRPLGSTALAVATALAKPVIVVPPDARPASAFRRVLVPIEGGLWTSLTPDAIVEVAAGAGLDVIVLHVLEDHLLPSFTDQPQHERPAWAHEFLRRYCPWGIETLGLETRVGRSEDVVPAVAVETEADLIALAWSQELAEGRAPVVRAALSRTRTPVMLVRVHVTSAENPRTGSAPAPMPAAR